MINHQQKFHVEKFVFTKTAKSYVIHISDTFHYQKAFNYHQLYLRTLFIKLFESAITTI